MSADKNKINKLVERFKKTYDDFYAAELWNLYQEWTNGKLKIYSFEEVEEIINQMPLEEAYRVWSTSCTETSDDWYQFTESGILHSGCLALELMDLEAMLTYFVENEIEYEYGTQTTYPPEGDSSSRRILNVFVAIYEDESSRNNSINGVCANAFFDVESAKKWIIEGLRSWLRHEYGICYNSIEDLIKDVGDDRIYWVDRRLIFLNENYLKEDFYGMYDTKILC